jgi:4-carboxymuconolactone decarboxylase
MHRQLAFSCFLLCVIGVLGVVAAQNQGSGAPRPNPSDVRLAGDRFAPLTYEQMTPEQKKMFENLLSGERRGAGGPFNVLLRSPEMGDQLQKFGATMRFHSSIPRKLNELAIIITARHWTAQYEWYAHRRLAQEAGLSQAVIDAIAAGKRPATMQPDEEAVYTFCTELITTKQVSDKTFQAAKDKFGERGVVDLIGVTGYYGLVSMLLNTDRYPLPEGVQPELKPLAQSTRGIDPSALTDRSRSSSVP